jgi:hypothetical protein
MGKQSFKTLALSFIILEILLMPLDISLHLLWYQQGRRGAAEERRGAAEERSRGGEEQRRRGAGKERSRGGEEQRRRESYYTQQQMIKNKNSHLFSPWCEALPLHAT